MLALVRQWPVARAHMHTCAQCVTCARGVCVLVHRVDGGGVEWFGQPILGATITTVDSIQYEM